MNSGRHKTDILDVVARKLSPFVLLFGCYLVAYGHLSPGGGFQGGVVLASGIILLFLSKGVEPIQQLFPLPMVNFAEMMGFLLFLMIGLAGLLVRGHFLATILPVGIAEEVPHAGFIFVLNLIIGLKVGAGITLLCIYLLKEENEDSS
jgi:multicomponent Na+:H+ antiporter subunit B